MRNSKETRTCIACRCKDNKYNLIRIANLKILDEKQNKHGRGFYICKKEECLEKLAKNKKINIDEKIYNELRGVILGE